VGVSRQGPILAHVPRTTPGASFAAGRTHASARADGPMRALLSHLAEADDVEADEHDT
jgi:hypothetical protein